MLSNLGSNCPLLSTASMSKTWHLIPPGLPTACALIANLDKAPDIPSLEFIPLGTLNVTA